jgi:hypothetical protein
VVSFAMTWPLNVLILTAVLSSTGKDGNAWSHYCNWIAFECFFLIFGLCYDYWQLLDSGLLSLFLFTHMRSLLLFFFWTMDAILLKLQYVGWHEPPMEIKLNVDGCSKGNLGTAGAGGILRDNLGTWC